MGMGWPRKKQNLVSPERSSAAVAVSLCMLLSCIGCQPASRSDRREATPERNAEEAEGGRQEHAKRRGVARKSLADAATTARATVADSLRARQVAAARSLGVPVRKDVSVATGVTIQFVLIPSGVFEYGVGDEDLSSPERNSIVLPGVIVGCPPRRGDRVKISRSFWISRTEIRQAQFEAVMNGNPSMFIKSTLPVHCVSFSQAQEFCRRVSRMTKTTARLPTEGEWEYACRAGSKARYSTGAVLSRKHARYAMGKKVTTADVRRGPIAVGSLLPNVWGVHDMHGNVSEWCIPWNIAWTPASRRPQVIQDPQTMDGAKSGVLRGGAWCDVAEHCSVVFNRGAVLIEGVPNYLRCGIRLVLDLPSP